LVNVSFRRCDALNRHSLLHFAQENLHPTRRLIQLQ
jgi:hypothetical protein